MGFFLNFKKKNFGLLGSFLCVLLLYWILLFSRLPHQFIQPFQSYSFGLFLFTLFVYFFIYRLPDKVGIIFGLGFTLLLFALTLAYKWQSGYTDNFLIGGLLPYKDAKNFLKGTSLILNGFPLEKAGQATERPLFPGFFSSLFRLTGNNLKISLALLVQFAGIGLYYSSRRVFRLFGATSASLYITLLFFYIQPWVGYTMSEIFGFFMGCIAFSLLWFASRNGKWLDLILGLVILMIAVSSRAGTFLIFPLLAIWVGWIFRGEKRFSMKTSIYAILIIIAVYLIVNTLYARIMGVPEGSSFGNFSYALYGQVRGGTGWHSAIEELGTRNPTIVYKAAFDLFRKHPVSLLIAIVKAYRDFFIPGFPNIFPFDNYNQATWLSYTIWLLFMVLLVFGLSRLIKDIRLNTASFLLAGFFGILISIPFLPPVDGGSRFYASTVPFFFVISASGVSKLVKSEQGLFMKDESSQLLRYNSVALIFLSLIAPVLTYSLTKKNLPEVLSCPSMQAAYVIQANPGSHVNFVQDGLSPCDIAPDICLADFVMNNSEFKNDDFYQKVYSMVDDTEKNIRIIPAINLLDRKDHYFFIDSTKELDFSSKKLVSGCATEILTKNQSIYYVESISSIK